jgi:uncharacterized membrane protein
MGSPIIDPKIPMNTPATDSAPSSRRKTLRLRLSEEEHRLIADLRQRKPSRQVSQPALTGGDRLADKVAATMGSWWFIVIQSGLLTVWVCLNAVAYINHWDPYPFILLNLMLSFQAAYAAPIIMMSQNRQAAVDRQAAKHDYEINLKAELEIELLHDQLQSLQEEELAQIMRLLQQQQLSLDRISAWIDQQRAN